MTKKDLIDAAKELAVRVDGARKSIDGGFTDQETIPPGDPRLAAIHLTFSDPAGPLNKLLTMLGGAPVLRIGAVSRPEVPAANSDVAVNAPAASIPQPSRPDDNTAVKLSFEEFLTSVGDSMLKAQRQLDSKSAEYLMNTETQPHVLPSIFRLPKLTASMKFAFDKQDTKKLNLVFFSSGSQESSQHQQQIQFDIVSAPAPLEALGQLRKKAPRLDFVLDLAERDNVFDAAQAANPGAKPTARLPQTFARDQALLVAIDSGQEYIFFFADNDEDFHVGIWLITLGAKPVLESIHRFDKEFAKAEGPLQQLVLQLGARQSELLSSLRG